MPNIKRTPSIYSEISKNIMKFVNEIRKETSLKNIQYSYFDWCRARAPRPPKHISCVSKHLLTEYAARALNCTPKLCGGLFVNVTKDYIAYVLCKLHKVFCFRRNCCLVHVLSTKQAKEHVSFLVMLLHNPHIMSVNDRHKI